MKKVLLSVLALVLVALVIVATAPASAAAKPFELLLQPDSLAPMIIVPFMVGALGSSALALGEQDYPPETLRQEFNRLLRWVYYTSRNGVMTTVVASLPVVNIATTASKVKTTNATVLKNAGVANALGASDDFWTLTGAAIANASGAAQFVRYLLCASAADAASVIRSDVAATKAACVFPNLPADGVAIVGILTVEIANGTTFTPGTTLLSAAGITDTYADGHDDDAVFALAGRVITK